MIEIELECLWHSDDTKQLSDLGMDYDINEVETRKITFYGISHISTNKWDDEHEFTNIFSLSGEQYISKLKYNQLKNEIAKQIGFNSK